jgi:hypothetical protein
MRRMLKSLSAVLDQIQPTVIGPLSVQLVPVIAFRVAQVGTFDGIFQLEVTDEKNRPVAFGEFSRREQSFRWKLVDPALAEEVTTRMMKVVNALPAPRKTTLRVLDRALAEAQITIPDEFLEKLARSIRGESADMYFGAPSPESVIHYQLRDPQTEVRVNGGEIIIRQAEPPEEITGECFGSIVAVDFQSEPEAVLGYDNAKQLYETQYPWFRPSRKFLERYQSENGTGREEEDADND